MELHQQNFLILFIILGVGYTLIQNSVSKQQKDLITLLTVSVALSSFFGHIAYYYQLKKNPELTFYEFFNGKYATYPKYVSIGMVSGIIFGFIDNAGLWLGMTALDPYLQGLDENTKDGLGNTFSDGLGAFLGTFAGSIMSDMYDVKIEDTPLWTNAVGVIIGCLLGIGFGRLISR